MELLANAVKELGGEVIGIMAENLIEKEIHPTNIVQL